MGYDMYVINQPQRILEIRERLYGAGERADGAERRALLEEQWKLEDETNSYFRLNIWGMGEYREVMERIGMLEWEESEPPFPDPAHYEIPMMKTVDGYENYDEDSPEYAAYRVALRVKLSHGTVGVIPGHKLCSNDGWIVTPEECEAALETYREYLAEGHSIEALLSDGNIKSWQEWIKFLETAATAGGFEVN